MPLLRIPGQADHRSGQIPISIPGESDQGSGAKPIMRRRSEADGCLGTTLQESATLDNNRIMGNHSKLEGTPIACEKVVHAKAEVLRLHFELGLGQRQIAHSCAVGQTTVHDYLGWWRFLACRRANHRGPRSAGSHLPS